MHGAAARSGMEVASGVAIAATEKDVAREREFTVRGLRGRGTESCIAHRGGHSVGK
jgi:hypothetical protein